MTAPPPFTTLRRFLPGKGSERCELCGTVLGSGHAHLLELGSRRLACACEPCSLLFAHRGASQYRRVGRRIRHLHEFQMSDAEWEGLAIPIGLAFFTCSTPQKRVLAFYPGPAGATESLLTLDAWNTIAARNAGLAEMEPDVEALLVNRVGAARDYYLVPIDRCYHLVGLIRMHWRGLSGGEEVWREIGAFFHGLEEASDA
ncbi:MAG TPA: DUF5947 family protein [Bryobacteraceae bacterium]|nr:DUF5947 family protein [Bryobacteraceae bacterium]